jgi:DNA repair photolyase
MKRFSAHTEPWGEFVDVKINAAEVLPVSSEKYRHRSLTISSVTDAYQPLEKKYRLTRAILEKLLPLEPALSILTKSDLVCRDIDLLRQFTDCEAGFSFSGLDERIRREIEPFAAPYEKRVAALRELSCAGVKNFLFVSPILPFFTDWKRLIMQTREFTGYYMFENLNPMPAVWERVSAWLLKSHPRLLKEYRRLFFEEQDYWRCLEGEISDFCRKKGIDGRVCFHFR